MADSAMAKPPVPWREVWLVALVPALDAVFRMGRIHPDEVFQALEPALSRAFGYGIMSWEWQVGLRNWFVPGLFSWLLKLSDALGLHDVQARRALLELPQYALHAGMLAAVFRFAARRVSVGGARLALWLVGLYPVLVWFGGRTMGESLSAALLVWGLERLDLAHDPAVGPGHLRGAALLGGALLGLAEVTRYGSAAIIVPAMLWLLVQRRWSVFGWAAAAGLAVAFALGLLDRVTWGDWFHSLRQYLDFNVFSGRAEQQFGAAPWHVDSPGWPAWAKLPWYAAGFVVAPWALAGAGRWLSPARRAERAWLFVVPAAVYVAAISATPHKELRFVYPALLVLTVAFAPSCGEWLRSLPAAPVFARASAAALLAATAALFVVPTPFDVQRPEQFQFTVRASRGATGFVLVNDGVWGSGGFFYLGQNVPWCTCDEPTQPCFQAAAHDARFNRGIYWKDTSNDARNQATIGAFVAAGFRLVDSRGDGVYFER